MIFRYFQLAYFDVYYYKKKKINIFIFIEVIEAL